MKKLYCWRCKKDVPALSESEYAEVHTLFQTAREKVAPLDASALIDAVLTHPAFNRVKEKYQELTGEAMGYPCLNSYHRESEFGPPCKNCGKPLRTKKASTCLLCGQKV